MTEDPLAFQFFNEIGIIDQLAVSMFERAMPKGMTQAQFTVLNHFVRLGIVEKSPAALASVLQVTRPTMTSTLGRLRRAGLVEIRPDPADGRAKLVSVTALGRTMRDQCIQAVISRAPLLARIAEPEALAAAMPLLREIRQRLDRARDAS
jgi:DNA-binding MarR family transcriptional regulator